MLDLELVPFADINDNGGHYGSLQVE